MPIYEYRCPDCEHDFEELMKFSDPTPPCPNCEGLAAERRVSKTSFILKGGGWYKDLYSGPSNQPGEATAKAPAEASPPKSTDSKSTDSKSTDSKSTDSKSSGTKSGDSKSSSASGSKSTSSSSSSSSDA